MASLCPYSNLSMGSASFRGGPTFQEETGARDLVEARRRVFVLHVLPLTLKASRRGLGLQRPCSQGFLKNPVYDGMLGVRMASIHPPCHRSPVDAWEANTWWTPIPHCPQQPVHWASKKYERGWPSLRRCDCSPSSRLQVCQSLR